MTRFLLLLVCVAGCSAAAGESGSRERLEGLAVASVAIAETGEKDEDNPQPDDPDDGECDTCGGQGWYRPDGRIRVDCPDCDASGLSRNKTLEPTRLRMITRDNCPPCEQWKREVLPELEDRGWVVGETVEIVNNPRRSTPAFEWVYRHEVGTAWQGYSDREVFLRQLRRAMGHR